MSETCKVGELARRTGVSVRTLHYYEEIGLLSPARRTSSGHRLYGRTEVGRLLEIRSLVQLGLPLGEVHRWLQAAESSPVRILRLRMAELDREIEEQQRLRQRLGDLARRLENSEEVATEDLLRTLEEMTMLEKHYTPEQLAQLQQRADRHLAEDPHFLKKAEERWRNLIARVRTLMEEGAAPNDPRVEPLAQEWKGLIDEFTGSDPGIRQSLGNLYREDHATVAQNHGDAVPTSEMMRFMGMALGRLHPSDG